MENSVIRLNKFDLKQLNNRSITKNIISVNGFNKVVTIDFEGIQFISRAAAHELITIISNLSSNQIHVNMINQNLEVQKMIEIVSKSIKTNHRVLTNLNSISFKTYDAFKEYMMAI